MWVWVYIKGYLIIINMEVLSEKMTFRLRPIIGKEPDM